MMTGVYTTVKLTYAVEFGYRVIRTHEIWHYQSNDDTRLFDGFITEFMKIKVKHSGWPDFRSTPETRKLYLIELNRRDSIDLSKEDITDNPAMCFLGKMMVNVS